MNFVMLMPLVEIGEHEKMNQIAPTYPSCKLLSQPQMTCSLEGWTSFSQSMNIILALLVVYHVTKQGPRWSLTTGWQWRGYSNPKQRGWCMVQLWLWNLLSTWRKNQELTHRESGNEPHPAPRGILEHGRTNGLKFTSECPTFILLLLYYYCRTTTITLFRFIIMLCGTNNILQNISHIQIKYENILHNIISPT